MWIVASNNKTKKKEERGVKECIMNKQSERKGSG